MNEQRETAVLGGGCFWCTEAVFKSLRGGWSVEPSYAGGVVPNPTMEATRFIRSLRAVTELAPLKEFYPAEREFAELYGRLEK